MGKKYKSTVSDSFNLDEVLAEVKKRYDRQSKEKDTKKQKADTKLPY